MSTESVAWALNLSHPPLTPTEKLVLIGICEHDGDGGAWPAMTTLARYAGISQRSARRYVASLEAKGIVRRDVQGGGFAEMPAERRPNRYIVNRHRSVGTRVDDSVQM